MKTYGSILPSVTIIQEHNLNGSHSELSITFILNLESFRVRETITLDSPR